MADCHNLFQDFYGKIKLFKSKEGLLEDGKKALRKKIRKYFLDNLKVTPPQFYIQGSYKMSTTINPLDGDYDLDDGVYLQNLDKDKTKWPTPEAVHKWIYDAVNGHTETKQIDKRTCVRVPYAGLYHIDLPIYCMHGGVPFLAEKGDAGWHVSDPRAVIEWFNDQSKNKDHIRRNVRYFKAWADNQPKSPKMPSSIVLTVLVTNHYQVSDRDDISFSASIERVYNKLLISHEVINPVEPSENLAKRITPEEMNNFKTLLKRFTENAKKALAEDDEEEAAKIWRKEFGDRFPLGAVRASSPILVSPSKPWCP